METLLSVPLFPLPRLVLFPGVRQPFFVFEPRYRAMLAAVLDGPGWIGVPQVLRGFEGNTDGRPPIARVMGVGRVDGYVTHPDGTSHIEVIGTFRALLREETFDGVFRTAKVSVLLEDALPEGEAESLRRDLSQSVRDLLPLAPKGATRAGVESLIRNPTQDVVALMHTLASVLLADPTLRQSLLEIDGVVRRGRRILDELAILRSQLLARRPNTDGEVT